MNLKTKNHTYRTKSSDPPSDEICVDVLSLIYFAPVVTCLAVEGSNAIQARRRGSIRHIACHLKCFISSDQGKSLHGISLSGFPGGHVEESWVKKTRIIDKAAEGRMAFVSPFARWISVLFGIKAICRNLLELTCERDVQ